IINADVLDAWFDPAPAVLDALRAHLPWLVRTSPPTQGQGLQAAIAAARGVPEVSVLSGAGSSDLLFLALRQWLSADSRVLLLDPTYGEYDHVCTHVLGCQVDRFPLDEVDGYKLDLARWLAAVHDGRYDLVVLVHPNNPTGTTVPRADLEAALDAVPAGTRVWVDEAYVDYLGPDVSVERYAAQAPHVVVCKSMSKTYALSGARAGYLCAHPSVLAPLRGLTPPWAVSLLGQVAAVAALGASDYYAGRYAETHALRADLAAGLRALDAGLTVREGAANYVLVRLPEEGSDAATLVAACRARGLFIRNVRNMGTRVGTRTVRLAVKDAPTQARMLDLFAEALADVPSGDGSPLEVAAVRGT
ncbi:MAG TPA: histidinol-phosphate transaminase, partial [Rhodothermales bacterium]|nr:histidinol-phosphate transaminase [Rhodothermales bacterium]